MARMEGRTGGAESDPVSQRRPASAGPPSRAEITRTPNAFSVGHDPRNGPWRWVLFWVNFHSIQCVVVRLDLQRILGSRQTAACRSPSVRDTDSMMLWSPDGLLHIRRLSRCSGESKIGLLVGLSKQLQSVDAILASLLAKIMKLRRHTVVRTVDHRRSRSNLIPQTNGLHAVFPRTLHGRNIDAEAVVCLESTADMKVGVASSKVTGNTCTLVRFAELAHLAPPFLGNGTESLGGLQFFRVSVFDLRGPQGTQDVSPVVACSALQGFPRSNRLADGLLSLAVELDGFGNHLLLQPFLFLVSVRLLSTGVLGRLHQIVFSPCHRAKNAFVSRRN